MFGLAAFGIGAVALSVWSIAANRAAKSVPEVAVETPPASAPTRDSSPSASPDDRFTAKVLPLLINRCVSCHGPDQKKGGLRLDSAAALAKGGDSGPAVKPGDPEGSLLIRLVRHAEPGREMPPKQRLRDDQIAELAAWIRAGAKWTGAETTETVVAGRVGDAWSDAANPVRTVFRGERLDLWSLKRPVRPAVPAVKDAKWVRNPIDAFLLARMEAAGVKPSAEADRRTLLRRLSFDLTGLPPTPEEADAFVADDSPQAYEKLADRLLASKHFGERWARHWLDVVRYADTNGFERDEFRPDMWRYRDYVVRAFNNDRPYDRFVREQLAGNELGGPEIVTDDDADRWIATGFLRLGPVDTIAAKFDESGKSRDEQMADLANTTGAAFLGLTFSCCQCHHHKYDPLLQEDHYRMRAFFAGARPRDEFVVATAALRAANKPLDAAVDAEIAPLVHEREGLLLRGRRTVAHRIKRDTAKVPEYEALAALSEAERKRETELAERIAALEKKHAPVPLAWVMSEADGDPPPTRLLFQGDFTQPREEVRPGVPSVFDPNPVAATGRGGRRKALADWIASPANPLTARVIVNRIWQHYFGRPLVATPNDFGYAGARPTNQPLLDWLAVELMEHGWSLKHIHRLIITSAAYRQASADDPEKRRLDGDNLLLWRQNRRRLDAESMRDAVLAVSGRLRPIESGRPWWPPVPAELLEIPGIIEVRRKENEGRLQDWYADRAEETDVRSLYLVQKRTLPLPLLQPFDVPDPNIPCGCRSITTVAPQALTLMNSPEAARWAAAFAERVAAAAGADPAKRIETAFRLALARRPAEREAAAAADLLARHTELHKSALKALTDLCRALLNVNEFVVID